MDIRRSVQIGIALCLLGPALIRGQVIWNLDFATRNYPFSWGFSYYSDTPPPIGFIGFVDIGPPYGNAVQLSADSSLCTSNWTATWVAWPPSTNSAPYDPARTFVSFDAFASKLKPFWVKLYYNGGSYVDTRNLQVDVNPPAAGSFQHVSIPLSSFAVTWLTGNPPSVPTAIEFGIRGITTNAALSWGFDSNNVLLIDNLSYVVVPALNAGPNLSIWAFGNAVTLSWPTNSTTFALQESFDLSLLTWTNVPAAPVVTNDINQVTIAPAQGRRFYRLKSL